MSGNNDDGQVIFGLYGIIRSCGRVIIKARVGKLMTIIGLSADGNISLQRRKKEEKKNCHPNICYSNKRRYDN